MANVKFLHQPGYIYDLLNIFILYFNKSCWNSNYINSDKANADVEFYNNILQEFNNIPNDLLVFFYLKNGSRSFIVNHYFYPFTAHLTSDYNFEFLRDQLSDSEILAENLFNFYFDKSDIVYESGNKRVLNNIIDLVENSNYPFELKQRLLAFFINPDKLAKKLIYELISKETLLSKYYEKNYKRALELQEKFSFTDFNEKFKNIEGKYFSLNNENLVYVSFCFVVKNAILSLLENNIIILGFDYTDCINMLINRTIEPELDILGKVLSEKNRIEILDLLNSHEEQSTSDIAKHLDLSVNAAYYHLDMMLQNNMIHCRNEGRTVFYRLNKNYFSGAGQALLKYSK